MSPARRAISTAPTNSRAGSTLANFAIARTLKPAIPVLDTPIKKAARHTSAHCQPVREINAYPNFHAAVAPPINCPHECFHAFEHRGGHALRPPPQTPAPSHHRAPGSAPTASALARRPGPWAWPCSLSAGQPFSPRRTWISCHATTPIPVPSALATASLAAHRAASDWAGRHNRPNPRSETRVVNRSPYRSTSPAIRRTDQVGANSQLADS